MRKQVGGVSQVPALMAQGQIQFTDGCRQMLGVVGTKTTPVDQCPPTSNWLSSANPVQHVLDILGMYRLVSSEPS